MEWGLENARSVYGRDHDAAISWCISSLVWVSAAISAHEFREGGALTEGICLGSAKLAWGYPLRIFSVCVGALRFGTSFGYVSVFALGEVAIFPPSSRVDVRLRCL